MWKWVACIVCIGIALPAHAGGAKYIKGKEAFFSHPDFRMACETIEMQMMVKDAVIAKYELAKAVPLISFPMMIDENTGNTDLKSEVRAAFPPGFGEQILMECHTAPGKAMLDDVITRDAVKEHAFTLIKVRDATSEENYMWIVNEDVLE